MKRFVEVIGVIAPLIVGALFALSGAVAPFGNAGDQTGPLFLIAVALVTLSFAVAIHLSVRTKSSRTLGIICGIGAGGISTFAFAEANLIGAAGYWQVMTAIFFSVAACAWSFHRVSTENY